MKTTVLSNGQIVLPTKLRQQDHIEPGQKFDVERVAPGEYRLVRKPSTVLACREGDFSIPIESESTDTL